jgi:hypothetical protein
MSVTQNGKEEIINRLLTARGDAQKLVITLSLAGKNEQAGRIKTREVELTKKIDELLAKAMRDWDTTASQHVAALKDASKRLRVAIKNVQTSIETTQNVTKAAGYLDESIEIAANLAKTIA